MARAKHTVDGRSKMWRELVWVTGDDRRIKVKDLEDYHLCNILNWIEGNGTSKRPPNLWQRTTAYVAMYEEACHRKLDWRHSIDPYWNDDSPSEAAVEALESIPIAWNLHDPERRRRYSDCPASRSRRFTDRAHMTLRDVDPGLWFTFFDPKVRTGKYMKVKPYGVTLDALMRQYRYSWGATQGVFEDHQGVLRCAIVSTGGSMFLEDATRAVDLCRTVR